MNFSDRRVLLLLRLCRPFIHGLIILWLFWSAIYLRRVTDLIPWIQLRIPVIDMSETMIFALISVVLFFLLGVSKWIYELYKPLHSYYSKFLETRFWWLLMLFGIAYLWFWFVFTSWISRFILIRSWVLFLVIWTIIDRIRNTIQFSWELRVPYLVQLIWKDLVEIDNLKKSLSLYPIYKVVWDDSLYHDITIVVGESTREDLQNIADESRIVWRKFYHVNEHQSLEDLIATPSRIWPVLALEYTSSPLDWRWRVIKRLFDIVVSLISIIILTPVMIVVAVLIALDSDWPIIYRHPRVWKSWSLFSFPKFRSMFTHLSVWEKFWWQKAWELKKELMESDANVRKGELQKIKNDPRVTKVWRFLRKTSLDELPNLFAVLRGDMSLVWPRPHEPFEVARYKSRQRRLLSVKPWMVWYAQLFGRDRISFDEEAKLDLYYIQHRSIFLDLYVLVNTIKVVFWWR